MNGTSTTQVYAEKLGYRELYVAHGIQSIQFVVPEGKLLTNNDLCSTQEEAHMRMFLHAFHAASNGYSSIAIVSSDTDVEVLHATIKLPSLPALHS